MLTFPSSRRKLFAVVMFKFLAAHTSILESAFSKHTRSYFVQALLSLINHIIQWN